MDKKVWSNLDTQTKMAIWSFEKVCKKEKQLEKAEQELNDKVLRIPDRDMPEYYNITEEMRQKYE